MVASIKGIVPLWSVFSGLCGAMFALFFALLLGIEIALIQGVFAFFGFILVFSIHRYIIGGRYPYENFDERVAIKEAKKENVEIELNKRISIRSSKVESEKFFLSASGLAVIGFKLDQNSILNFNTFVQTLFSKLKQGVRIRLLKSTRKSKGTIEPDLKFLDSELYLFIEVSNLSLSRDDTIESFWNVLELYGSPLDIDEIRNLTKDIVAPGRALHDWEIKDGLFPSPLSLIKKEALLHYGDIEKQAAIFSLAQIASEISVNYQKVLDVLGSLEGTTCVTFESLGQVSVMGEALRKKTEDLEAYEKHESEREKTVASKYKINTKMTTIVICHGSSEEIKTVEKDLDANYRAIPTSELPIWRREHGLFEKALISMFPGSNILLPERRQHRIIDSEEAFYYFPHPIYKGLPDPVIELETSTGERYGLRLRKKYPLFIWSGVGDGKSITLGYILKNYILRSKEGQKIATFTLETGGSCSFVHDDGLVDLAFMLEETRGEFKPFPVPPLKLFLSFETKGLTQAKEWLVTVSKCKDDLFANLLSNALFDLKQSGKYRLKDYYEILEQKVKETFTVDDPAHYSRQYLMSIKRICDFEGSLYGKIFDVEDNGISIALAKHYYFTQIPAPKSKNDLTDIFYSFAHNTFLCFETSITGDNYHELLLCIDELHNIFKVKALSHSQVRDFNSQGRKEGKDIVIASQELEDLLNDETGDNLINSFKEFLFASAADPSLILKALKKMASSESKDSGVISSLEDLNEIINDIRTYRTQKKKYMWALIDYRGKVNLLNFTLPLKKIWQQASESAAKELRANLAQKYNRSKAEIIDIFDRFKMPVPEERSDIDLEKLKIIEQELKEQNK